MARKVLRAASQGKRKCKDLADLPRVEKQPKRRRTTALEGAARDGQAEDVRLDPIKDQRKSITIVTSTWANGSPGPLAICAAEGMISEKIRTSLNNKYKGQLLIMSSGSDVHFMNGETNMEMRDSLLTRAPTCEHEIVFFLWPGSTLVAPLQASGRSSAK